MLRGLYTAASGMISQQRKHDTITNNISNLNTPGFKQDYTVSRSFPEFLISLTGEEPAGSGSFIGRLNTGVLAEENLPSFVQGDLQETNNPLDFALVSNLDGAPGRGSQAFFTVHNSEGEYRYIRNGKFLASETGELITAEGYRVIGQDGQPILLTDDATDLAFMITRIEDPHRLIREGNGAYRLDPEDNAAAGELAAGDQVQVMQGYIERSNVDPIQSMIDLNAALRAYEANQKILQYYDRNLEKAVNEVGRV